MPEIISANYPLHITSTPDMSFHNQAAWLPGKGARLQVGSAEAYQPAPGEVLVRNRAVAINPVDSKMQDEGYFIDQYPAILGADIAGEVAAVGEDVTHVLVGQRVLAHVTAIQTRKPANGSFQNYSIALAQATTPLPDSIAFESAAVIPLALSTAAAGLYQSNGLKLPLPASNPENTGRTLLVWGGSSSVGATTIQLARASGLEVIAIASKRNFGLVKSLGAHEVFDYSNPGIVGDLVAVLKDKQVAGAYDAIGHRETALNVAQVLAQLGGGVFACSLSVPDDIAANVTGTYVFAPAVHHNEVGIGKAVFMDFLPEALGTGQFKPAPEAKIVGHGLETLQEGVDLIRKGVSATKLVVTL